MPRWNGILVTLATLCVACLCLGAGNANAAAWWTPPQQLTWYWQLDGTPPNEPTDAVDFDGFDATAAQVAALHARGQRAICYIDVGTYEPGRPDDSEFPASVKGSGVQGWAGEYWLDISQLSVLEPIMSARFEMCAQKGFDAVEPDNIDGYENSTGFNLTAAEQLTYDEWIAQEVHSLGMAVFQKNDPDQASQLEPYFDGELDEECNYYDECSAFAPYLAAGKPVLDAEYTEDGETTAQFCAADESQGIMGALYSLALDGSTYSPCFGPSVLSGPITGGPFSGTTAGGSTATPAAAPFPTPRPPVRTTPTVDRTPPHVTVTSHLTRPARGELMVSVRCARRQSYCAGTLSVSRSARSAGHKRLALTSQHFRVRGGHVATLTLKLRTAALRRLPHRGSLRVLVTVKAHDRAGHHARTSRKLTLPAPPRHRRATRRRRPRAAESSSAR
jgi:hypothetical protein